MKNIILIAFIFFISGCGYEPVYKKIGNQDFRIDVIQMSGDVEINNLIKNEISLYSGKESINKFNVTIKTDFYKKILSKNNAGVITDYELSASSSFKIYFEGKTEKVTFNETINVKNKTDTFEQNLYEKNIKRNFASSIREKLILKILSIK